jgi:hypothetical protein
MTGENTLITSKATCLANALFYGVAPLSGLVGVPSLMWPDGIL